MAFVLFLSGKKDDELFQLGMISDVFGVMKEGQKASKIEPAKSKSLQGSCFGCTF